MENFPYYSTKNIKHVLNEYGASPLKKWGQNYLIDRNIIDSLFRDIPDKIPHNTENLVEIGIGLGALTHKILELGYPCSLIEIDPISCRIFQEGIGKNISNSGFNLIQGDCREYIPGFSGKKPFIFGNLPYYITSDIITDCLENIPDLTGFLFLVQKEFSDRIVNEISSLSIFIRGFGIPERLKIVKKGSFYPQPKIDSALLYFKSYSSGFLKSPKDIAIFSALLRTSFWGKRKKLSTSIRESPNSLFPMTYFSENDIDLFKTKFLKTLEEYNLTEKRPDELSIETWLDVARNINQNSGSSHSIETDGYWN